MMYNYFYGIHNKDACKLTLTFIFVRINQSTMNKYFVLLLALCLSIGIFAQEGFKFGIQAGIPLDDYNDAVSVVLGADFSSMYPLGEVVDVGPAVGYIHGFAETFQTTIIREEQEAVQFLPLSAGVRFWTSKIDPVTGVTY